MTNTHTKQTINENAHSKIMKDMVKFLDNCKEKKNNCQCSGVLKFNPNEQDEFKKWSFLYQCDDDKNKVKHMENITFSMLKNIDNYKQEIYNVEK
jgi:hypothetical protein